MCNSDIKSASTLGFRLNKSLGFRMPDRTGEMVKVFKCANCGLIYPEKIIRHEASHFGSVADVNPPEQDQVPYEGAFENELVILRRLSAKPLQECSALDIGFGYGNVLIKLKRNFKDVKGIEPYQQKYRFSIAHPELRDIKDSLSNQSFEHAVFESESFDFIFFEAFQHTGDPSAGLAKALKWLKPGGIIYMEVPSSSWLLAKLINFYYKLRRTSFITNLSPFHGNYTNYEFSLRSFIENGKINHFKILYYHFYPCQTFMKGIADSLLRYIMKLTDTGMQMGVFISR